MSKIEELTQKYGENLEKAKKEREAFIQRINQLSSLIEQLTGALFALKEAASPEQKAPEAPPADAF